MTASSTTVSPSAFPRLWAALRLTDKVVVDASTNEKYLPQTYSNSAKYLIAEMIPVTTARKERDLQAEVIDLLCEGVDLIARLGDIRKVATEQWNGAVESVMVAARQSDASIKFPRLWAVLRTKDNVVAATGCEIARLTSKFGDSSQYRVLEVGPAGDLAESNSDVEFARRLLGHLIALLDSGASYLGDEPDVHNEEAARWIGAAGTLVQTMRRAADDLAEFGIVQPDPDDEPTEGEKVYLDSLYPDPETQSLMDKLLVMPEGDVRIAIATSGAPDQVYYSNELVRTIQAQAFAAGQRAACASQQ